MIQFKHALKSRYGLTVEEYRQRVSDQGGLCALCGKPPLAGTALVPDHDHTCCATTVNLRKTCGKCLRGLLCKRCNTLLGHVEVLMREGLFEKGLEYIERWKRVNSRNAS